jgi:hypothetical protein
VTYTGNDAANRQISHSLGSTPGCIIVKKTNESGAWYVYHRSLGNWQTDTPYTLYLNTTDSQTPTSAFKGNAPTSTTFTVDGVSGAINETGKTYVAYLFAHNAGGFGLTGTDNVISCGSFTTDGYRQFSVNLGYEPQWVLQKPINQVFPWQIIDTMRGFVVSEFDQVLAPNTSGAEGSSNNLIQPTATGFKSTGTGDSLYADETYIYIAIRRGPMKVPTSGTSVFTPIARTGTGADATVTSVGFPVDLLMSTSRQGNDAESFWDRLRNIGGAGRLLPSSTSAEIAGSEDSLTGLDVMDGFRVGVDSNGRINYNPWTYVYHCFRRAPSFFDVVCYTGTGTSNSSVNHNLGVVPELFFVKRRNSGGSGDVNWGVYSKDRPSADYNLILNSTTGWYNAGTNGWFGTGTLSSTLFPSGNASANFGNLSGGTYVAYLFATCAGVSKVGSYTGNGSSQNIDCGFTSGARFILIKRTDNSQFGDWKVFDSARGIVSGNDPYLKLNDTDAEQASYDGIDPYSAGFTVNQDNANLNISSATYIFLAIA